MNLKIIFVFLFLVIAILSSYFLPEIDLTLPQTAKEHHEEGLKQQKEGNHWRARDSFSKAIKLEPQNPDYYFLRGTSQMELGYLDEAIADFSATLARDARKSNAYYNRALAHGMQRRYDAALKDFDMTIQLQPNDVAAYRDRGLTRERTGDVLGAIDDYQKAISLNSQYALAHLNLGSAFTTLRRYDDAKKSFTSALQINPTLKKRFDPNTTCGPFWNPNTNAVDVRTGGCD